MKHTIDATNQKVGRIASQAASFLMGKNLTTFTRNTFPKDVKVEIVNASKCAIDSKKAKQTDFARYSGFPGGLRYETVSDIITKKGYSEVIRQAVEGMLPKNTLRPRMIKNLSVKE